MKTRVEIQHGTGYKSLREFNDSNVALKWAKAEVRDPDSPLFRKKLRVVGSKRARSAVPGVLTGYGVTYTWNGESRTARTQTGIRGTTDVEVAVDGAGRALHVRKGNQMWNLVAAEDVVDFEDDVGPYTDLDPALDEPKAETPPPPPVHPLVPAILELRYLSMVSQQLHWTTSGPTAPSDHELMRKLYEVANDSFDKLAERAQGLPGLAPPPVDQQAAYVLSKTAVPSATMADVYARLLDAVVVLNATSASGALSPGTANLVQGIADELEAQAYFVGQRVR